MSENTTAIVMHGSRATKSRARSRRRCVVRYRIRYQILRYIVIGCDELWQKAYTSPASLTFREAERLASCFGFALIRQRGSHRIYKAPGIRELVNLQERGKMAKPYQVRQLLKLIDTYDLAERGDDDEATR